MTQRQVALIVWLAFACSKLIATATADEPLSPELLAHGVRQVENMVKDRPNMGAYATDTDIRLVTRTDPFYDFAVRKFAGEDTKSPVFWDATQPAEEAEHRGATDDEVGVIRVDRKINSGSAGEWRGREKAFEVLWSQAIFELNNISGSAAFLELHDRALNGTIEREAYIMDSAKSEHVAYLKTNKFFKERWVPWAIEVQLKPSTQRFLVAWNMESLSFDDWISKYTDRKGYPWIPFGDFFDEATEYRRRFGTVPTTSNPSIDYWKALQEVQHDIVRPILR
jgi:hypothetical protein